MNIDLGTTLVLYIPGKSRYVEHLIKEKHFIKGEEIAGKLVPTISDIDIRAHIIEELKKEYISIAENSPNTELPNFEARIVFVLGA